MRRGVDACLCLYVRPVVISRAHVPAATASSSLLNFLAVSPYLAFSCSSSGSRPSRLTLPVSMAPH